MQHGTLRLARGAIALALLLSSVLWPAGTALAAAGAPDPTFEGGGIVTTDATAYAESISAMVVQPDGKIVAGGTATDDYQSGPFALARYNSDGSLDTSFGTGGVATVSFGAGWSSLNALAVQPDGRIVAGGVFYTPGNSSRVVAMARFCPDGTLDTGTNCPELTPKFATGGKVTMQLSTAGNTSLIEALAVQEDGKIVAGGISAPDGFNHEFALVRFNTDGSLDTTFGGDGKMIPSSDGIATDWTSADLNALALLPDGRIVAAGYAYGDASGGNYVFGVARYCPDGSPDTGANCPDLQPKFGINGTVSTVAPPESGVYQLSAYDLVLQPDGRLVVAGVAQDDFQSGIGYAVARYEANGALDPGFDGDGLAFGIMDVVNQNGDVRSVALDAAGRILVGGSGTDINTYDSFAAIARLCPDGSLDTGGACSPDSFGTVTGLLEHPFGDGPSSVKALAVLPDGKLLAAGSSNPGSGTVFTLGRFLGDGPLNAAPTLDDTKTPAFTAVDQTQSTTPTNGSTDGSMLVSQLIDAGGPLNNFSDTDGDPAGLAIIGLGGGGTWWYTTDGGAHWNMTGLVSAASALLLSADTNTRMYYQNDGGAFNGMINPAIRFYAWDGSSGTAGTKANAGTWSVSSAFSPVSDSAALEVVDNVAPSVTGVAVPGSDWYKDGQTLEFVVTYAENVTVNTGGGTPALLLTIGSSTVNASYISGSGSSQLTFRYTVESGDADTDGIAVGPVVALNGGTIRDAAGNDAALTLNAVDDTTGVRVDTTAPAAPSILIPADGALISDTTPSIAGSAEANSTVTVEIDGTPVGTTTTAGNGDWIFVPGTPLSEGPHTVKASATDAAGNVSALSSATSFTVDVTPPAAPTINPLAEDPTDDATPELSGTAEADSTVTLFVDDVETGTTTAGPTGAWSYTPGSALNEGARTLHAVATDGAGNTSEASGDYSFTVDTEAPAAPAVSSPTAGMITPDTTPPVEGTAEANSTVTVYVDGSSQGTSTATALGDWSIAALPELGEGTHSLRATATDAAGNTSADSESISFTVDTVAPSAPTITSPEADGYTNDPTPTLAGTAEANSTVTLFLDSSEAGTTSADGSGHWTFTPASALAEGAHQAYATATDAALHTSPESATIEFTVDSQAPSIISIQRATSSPTTAAQLRFNVTFSEAISGLTVDNFGLDTSGVAGASFVSLTGAEATYVVTVDTGSGSGTIGVNLTSETGVTDQAGNALTGAPKIGEVYTVDRTATLDLQVKPLSATYGQPVFVTATVTAALAMPSGQVSFFDGGESIGQETLDDSGVAALRLALPAAGTHLFTATYEGDGTFEEVTSTPVSQAVKKATPVVELTSSKNPAPGGQSVSLTARVTSGSLSASGVVTFIVDGLAVSEVTLSGGTASLTTSALSVGSHTVTASYRGDDNFLGKSASLTQVIEKNQATVTLSRLAQAYTGTPRPAGITTNPAGLGVTVTYSGSLTAPISAGSYAVLATVTDPNYAGTAEGTLVIAKAPLSVVSENQVRRTGQDNRPLSFHYAGFVNHETSSVLSGAPLLSTVASAASPAGIYPITAVTGTLSATNYRFLFFNASLTVHAPPVVAQSLPDTAAMVGRPFLFSLPSGTFTDADPADRLAYTATLAGGSVLPDWLTFSPAARTFVGTPTQPGQLTIQVKATDSWGDAATDEFVLLVEAQPVQVNNRAPVAVDDAIETTADTPVTANLLANDSDPDGDALHLQSVSALPHGSLTFTTDGVLTYTPNPLFGGVETAVYSVSDGRGGLAQGAITVTTQALTQNPLGVDDAAATLQDEPVTIPVLENDVLNNGATGAVSGIQRAPQHGTAGVNQDGTVTYSPNAGYTGSDTFSYWLTQSGAPSGAASAQGAEPGPIEVPVTVIVGRVEDDAVAVADEAATDENQPVTVEALANDAVAEGTMRLIGVNGQPQHGTVVIQPDGTLRYTPERYWSGTDTFTYSMGNGLLGYATAPVTVTVQAVNQLPMATNDAASVLAGSTLLIDVVANDSDVEDGKPALVAVNPGQHGATAVQDGKVTYTPDADFQGTDRFVYTVRDSAGDLGVGLVTVQVTLSRVLYYFPRVPAGLMR